MKKFNAKLLLFGEYGLMVGAMALAVPFSHFKGSLDFVDETAPENFKNSQLELDRFVSYFHHHQLNKNMNFPLRLEEIKKDLERGMYFNSDIPLQYGVGSSAALCAAVYERYGNYQLDLKEVKDKKNLLMVLKNDFSVMEAYFHGQSSGFDPLVSFINRPVLLEKQQIDLPSPELKTPGFAVFLIDTEVKSPTAPLVRLFLSKLEDEDFETSFRNEFLPANDLAVQSLLNGETPELFKQLNLISAFQAEHLQEMIPAHSRQLVNELAVDGIPVKLLGSGGGGFLLAFVPEGTTLPGKVKSLKVY
jgi:mevalonate kinase